MCDFYGNRWLVNWDGVLCLSLSVVAFGLFVEAVAAKEKEKEESKRATSLYKLRQLITDEEIAKTGSKSDRKDKKKKAKTKKRKKSKQKKSQKRRHSSSSSQSNETPLPARKRSRERSWTYSEDSSASPQQAGGHQRHSSNKSVGQHGQTQRVASPAHHPLQRAHDVPSPPRKKQKWSESGGAGPSSGHRSQGSDYNKYHHRPYPLSQDSHHRKPSHSSSKPLEQEYQYGGCRSLSYPHVVKMSHQSDSSSPERQKFRTKPKKHN